MATKPVAIDPAELADRLRRVRCSPGGDGRHHRARRSPVRGGGDPPPLSSARPHRAPDRVGPLAQRRLPGGQCGVPRSGLDPRHLHAGRGRQRVRPGMARAGRAVRHRSLVAPRTRPARRSADPRHPRGPRHRQLLGSGRGERPGPRSRGDLEDRGARAGGGPRRPAQRAGAGSRSDRPGGHRCHRARLPGRTVDVDRRPHGHRARARHLRGRRPGRGHGPS